MAREDMGYPWGQRRGSSAWVRGGVRRWYEDEGRRGRTLRASWQSPLASAGPVLHVDVRDGLATNSSAARILIIYLSFILTCTIKGIKNKYLCTAQLFVIVIKKNFCHMQCPRISLGELNITQTMMAIFVQPKSYWQIINTCRVWKIYTWSLHKYENPHGGYNTWRYTFVHGFCYALWAVFTGVKAITVEGETAHWVDTRLHIRTSTEMSRQDHQRVLQLMEGALAGGGPGQGGHYASSPELQLRSQPEQTIVWTPPPHCSPVVL